ncbi:hypothetical protein CEUSTIGMA_g5589.t1 [Chlamydomonas eustigma]|uniref:Uncharacterized protein n=1 Tax=Chlamydomonas eustigma TaxID=1157962 RepID=A0A250X4X9_9CHLO|nr:hypothetical protein CEUSTIGMA_g5589.t1 [Chlamydomonas eustigma]|eukprot:GAX78147.1 hypothetical protein CEUSTIGMA_g5589.t1 [Chlamydomonas eustigma]
MSNVAEAFGSDEKIGVEILFGLLAEASAGRDVSSAIPQIISAVFGKSQIHPHTKKLALDLCKFTIMSDPECEFIIKALKRDWSAPNQDIIASGKLSGLKFIPHMPPHYLSLMLEIGDIQELIVDQLHHSVAEIREAAVASLHQVLMKREVLQAVAEAPGLASTAQDLWILISDKLLDEEAAVTTAAVVAVTDLIDKGKCASATTASGFLLQRLGSLCVGRVAAALGPVLESCACVLAPAQVSVARMLLLMVRQLMQPPPPGSGALSLRPGSVDPMMLPGLGDVVPAACSYLHDRIGAVDIALRLEACRSLLAIMSMVKASHVSTNSLLVPAFVAIEVPEVWAASAVSSLLELEGTMLSEGGLPEAVLIIARSLAVLPVLVRSNLVRKLLPLASSLTDVPTRMEVYTLVWAEVMEQEIQGEGLSLASIFSDPYVSALMKGSLGGALGGGGPSESTGMLKTMTETAAEVGKKALDVVTALGEAAGEMRHKAKGLASEAEYQGLKTMDVAGESGARMKETTKEMASSMGTATKAAAASAGTASKAALASAGVVAGEAGKKTGAVASSAGNTIVSAAGHGYDAALSKLRGRPVAEAKEVEVAEGQFPEVEWWQSPMEETSQALGEGKEDGASEGGDPAAAPGKEKKKSMFKSLKENIKGAVGISSKDKAAKDEASSNATAAATSAAAAAEAENREKQQQQQQQSGAKGGRPPVGASGAVKGGHMDAFSSGGQTTMERTSVPIPVPTVVMLPSAPGANVIVAPPELTGAGATGAGSSKRNGHPVTGLATYRHEVVTTLLDEVVQRASSYGVMELCLEAQAAAVKDQSAAFLASHNDFSSEQRVMKWIRLARETLSATQACVWWEPVVTPTITTTLSSEAEGHASADFSSVPSDVWLQLLQAACHASNVVSQLLAAKKRRVFPSVANGHDVAAAAAVPEQDVDVSHAIVPVQYDEDGTEIMPIIPNYIAQRYHPEQGRRLQQQQHLVPGQTPHQYGLVQLQNQVEDENRQLQVLLRQLLRGWSGLSRLARMRVLWVVTHHLSLPPALDESWESTFKALADTMSRSSPSLRLQELMASASLGSLFRSERQSWPRDKPFIFDIVAASALCERPELELCSLICGLACIQHLATKLQSDLAAAVAAQLASENGDAAAEETFGVGMQVTGSLTAKQVQVELVLIAARLEAIAREIQGTDSAASPQIKEWLGRIMRMCGAVSCYEPPIAASTSQSLAVVPEEAAESAAGAASAWAGPSGAAAAAKAAAADSDSSSEYRPIPGVDDIMMPVNMYGRPPQRPPQAPAPVMARVSLSPQSSQKGLTPRSLSRSRVQSIIQAPPTTVMTNVPPPPYLARSCVGDCIWGYPFSGPRTSILFSSKRSRRHRALLELLASARRQAHTQNQMIGTELNSSLQPQLSQEDWQELTGPADPLLIRGRIQIPSLESSSISSSMSDTVGAEEPSSGDTVVVVIEVSARLMGGVEGAEIFVRTLGPAVTERRGIHWKVPKMTSAGDKVQRTFSLRLLGYDPTEVTICVQLYSPVPDGEMTPVLLYCQPLRVSMVATLRPTPAVSLLVGGKEGSSAADFFRLWSALPARAEISGVCAWRGVEGQALALSSMLRQPLSCAMLQYCPASSSYQAAFSASTLSGDQLLLLVYSQLMLPSAAVVGSAGGVASGVEGRAACQVYVRSSSPEVVHAIQLNAGEWLRDLSGGSVLYGLSARGLHAVGVPRPPLDARVAALHRNFLAFASPSDANIGHLSAPLSGASLGPKVPHSWLRKSALTEWQRLAASACE